MELKLQNFVEALGIASNIEEMSDDTPQVIRRTNSISGKVSTFVCSRVEPVHMVLPLNYIWINFDTTSTHYRKALKRESKDPTAPYQHTYKELYFYEDVWAEMFYDDADKEALKGTEYNAATITELGLVMLSVPAEDPAKPKVVAEGDPRLTDARDPKPHTHPEKPASQLAHSGGVVTITGGAPADKAVLVATSSTEAVWRRLTQADIGS